MSIRSPRFAGKHNQCPARRNVWNQCLTMASAPTEATVEVASIRGRFRVASNASSKSTTSLISQSRSVTPAAIAGRHLERLMDADEIIVEKMQRHRVGMVLDFF